jgi:Xaa-Pro aminopeptidase
VRAPFDRRPPGTHNPDVTSFARPEALAARARAAFLDRMEDGDVALFAGAGMATRNHDVEHPFRQESGFWYLTACPEPDAWLILAKGVKDLPEAELFVLPRDRDREIWNGRRLGPEGARERLGFPAARVNSEFAGAAAQALARTRRAWVRLGAHAGLDRILLPALGELRARARVGVQPPECLLDPGPVLDELRLIKHEDELALMRHAASLTAQGHLLAMAAAAPGVGEWEIEALLSYTFRRHGGDGGGWSYPAIVAGGANACILHYNTNHMRLNAGDLLLIDAGAEYGSFAGDVTRTFPVDGVYTPPQRAIYEVVLAAQLASLARCRAGTPFEQVHEATVDELCRGLVALGVHPGPWQACKEQKDYRRWYMHNTSHWLGLDVHDAGQYRTLGASRPLQPGMVLTVEPGLYFQPDDDTVPEEFRGIGVRIEDDVHVTGGAPEVLTAAIPKTIADVEAACASELPALPALETVGAAR